MFGSFGKLGEVQQILIIVAIIIVLIILYGVLWYTTGWNTQTYSSTDKTAATLKPNSGDLRNLKFKKCIFTIYDSAGQSVGSTDVTSKLIAMVKAYNCGNSCGQISMQSLNFYGQLSKDSNGNPITVIGPMSFYISGVNYSSGATITDQNASQYSAKLVVNYKESLI